MVQTLSPNDRLGMTAFNEPPCEGAEEITLDLRFDLDANQFVDLSTIQNTGKWSGWMTVYIDNSLNNSAIYVTTQVARQTLTVPPLSCFLMPILVPNPPKVLFNSAGAVAVRMNILNYFLPPCVWSPTSPPGGSSGGGVTAVIPTDLSILATGAADLVIAANAARKAMLIANQLGSGVNLSVQFGVGGTPFSLAPGATYESGAIFWSGDVYVTATAGTQIVAYEGT